MIRKRDLSGVLLAVKLIFTPLVFAQEYVVHPVIREAIGIVQEQSSCLPGKTCQWTFPDGTLFRYRDSSYGWGEGDGFLNRYDDIEVQLKNRTIYKEEGLNGYPRTNLTENESAFISTNESGLRGMHNKRWTKDLHKCHDSLIRNIQNALDSQKK